MKRPVRQYAALLLVMTMSQPAATADVTDPVQIGPRPYWLVDQMKDSPLKEVLASCAAETHRFEHSDFSIAHRGAPLQFPEHTMESYLAAHRMGAGIQECDVTFTADGELVCRHAQCDLHTTTNILSLPLAEKCSEPFTPASFDDAGKLIEPASARCCASDLTLSEFKSLAGKMDASDPTATTVNEYLGGTADTRTDLYATGAMLLSHRESIDLIKTLGGKFTPELKAVTDGFGESGLDQHSYAAKVIEEYIDAGIDPQNVWPQSFFLEDVLFWVENYPSFGEQAVFLDSRNVAELAENPPSVSEFSELKHSGVNIIAPPMPVLLAVNHGGEIIPSDYAMNAKAADLDIISWTTERSGRLIQDVVQGDSQFYYQTTLDALQSDGDIFTTMDVLAQQVGIIGLFSDWPATTTFYANCVGLH
ncbi:MAG: glycerophosphodiester phosphodiesterase [Granulosicoccus sp.]|nr:glycerophosphodiester phosphodiesterase [Granulosicoccus sp.]